jgi:predicted metalloprotease with PDZ domain
MMRENMMHQGCSLSSTASRLSQLIRLLLLGQLLWIPQSIIADDAVVSRSKEDGITTAPRAIGPTYKVDLSQALTRYITVTMSANPAGDETELMMPTWTPGSYLIREYAKHIDRILANDSTGKPLKIQKISKNRWRVATKDVTRFEVSYRLFCDEISVRTNSVDFNRAVLNGAATFLSIPQQQDRVHRIKLVLPKGWNTSSTSLQRGRSEHSYFAENYDEVVDSPIVAGNVMVYPFEVAGVPHYLVNVGQSNDFDHQTATADLTKLIEQHHRLWGEVPYNRYYFITVFGGGGGLEHDNCCLMMVPRLDLRDRAGYRGWLSLASHEFFHTWNIRRLRPKELVKYDYENETYTPSLWIAEGTTSYYEDLLLVRAGLIDRDEYIQSLNASIQQLQRTDGRLVQSLRDSSHDAWIKFYRPESNSRQTQISYYTKGAVVSLLLDIQIRAATAGQKSLDDVLRLLWSRHRQDNGYLESEFRELCNEVAGRDLSSWFAQAVDSTNELDYQEMANWLGLEIGNIKPQRDPSPSASKNDESAKPSTDTTDKQLRRWIGIGEFDSPATKAGLADTDEVIGINGQRVSEGEVESVAQKFQVGEPINVLVARNGKLEEILLVVGARDPVVNWSVEVAGRTSRQQRKNLRDWLSALPSAAETTKEKTDSTASEESNEPSSDKTISEAAKKSSDRPTHDSSKTDSTKSEARPATKEERPIDAKKSDQKSGKNSAPNPLDKSPEKTSGSKADATRDDKNYGQ